MNIEDNPELTAYVLDELTSDEAKLLEEQFSECEHSARRISDDKVYASMIRDAYNTEPAYAMTPAQRQDILKGSEIVAFTGSVPEKILSFSDKSKSFDKNKIETQGIGICRKYFPCLLYTSDAADE